PRSIRFRAKVSNGEASLTVGKDRQRTLANTVRNTSRPGIYVKLSVAKRWIDQCVCEWVKENISIRELSTSERLSRMAANLERFGQFSDNRPKSKRDSYLPPINCCGEREILPKSEIWTSQVKYECLVQARELASL